MRVPSVRPASARGLPSARQLTVWMLVIALLLGLALSAGGCRPDPVVGPGDGNGDGSGGTGDGGAGGGDGSGGDGSGGGDGTAPGVATADCPLCGRAVAEDRVRHRPLAVVIDNLAAARPQSGLGDACLVYEVLVEGGITRLVAFYLHEDPAAVGPVRSLRPYMLDLAMPLGAVTTHVGGSPHSYDDLASLAPAAMDVDSMGYGAAFWRMQSRRAPHNTYTGVSLMRAASQDLGYEGTELAALTASAFRFDEDLTADTLPAGQSASRFTLSYATVGGYSVTYDYDTESAQWVRYLAGSAHIDAATGRQLRSTTVIVQYVASQVITGDKEGRLQLAMVGSGDTQVFTLGQVVQARWTKGGRTAVTIFTDQDGQPLKLPPGSVWVLIAPPGSRLDIQ